MKPVIENLLWEMTSWKSLELSVHEERNGADGKNPDKIVYQYIETHKGQRMYRMRMIAPGFDHLDESYCDGARCATISFDAEGKQQTVSISKSFGNEARFGGVTKPIPLEYFFVGLTPLHQAIAKGKKTGEGKIAGRPTEIFYLSRMKCGGFTFDFVYHLDRETSIPLRAEVYRDAEMFQKGWHTYVWEADSFDRVGKYHWPRRSHYVSYVGDVETQQPKPNLKMNIIIDSVKYDQTYDASTFWPKFEPGVQVFDGIKDTAYKAPGEVKAVEKKESSTAAPLRAVRDEGWLSRNGPMTLSLASAVLLAFVGLMWWRRR